MILFDFADQSHHKCIGSFPIFDFGDEIPPNLNVGLASHQKPLELRKQLVEVLNYEGAEELVHFQKFNFLRFFVYEHLIVENLNYPCCKFFRVLLF